MHSTSTPPPDYGGIARDMRERFLVRPAAEWGMHPTAENPTVYGVLMEWMADDATLIVAAFCDGSASVYRTRGLGMIGGHADDVVRSQARALVADAADFHEEAALVSEFPYPGPDQVQFYLLTFRGVRVLDAPLDAVFDGRSPYAGLYDHGWAVFERLLSITGPRPVHEGGCGNREERSDAEAYADCLLTWMACGMCRSIVICAAGPVPELATLAEGNGRLQDWLTLQALPYESLDGKAVVRAIRRAAGIAAGLRFLTRRAELLAIHSSEDGEPIACVYDIEIAPFDRFAKIILAPPEDRRVVALQRQADARAQGVAST